MERAEVPSMNREQRLTRWIEEYSDSILHTCFLYLSDQSQAEDATQDTWIKAWKHMSDFERQGIANEKAWLLRIAINTCKDYRRSAWFRHVDRKQALDELPPQLVAVEPEDHSLTLMVIDLPDRLKQVILLWTLDVTFNEDNCQIYKGNAPQNFSIIRKIAEKLLRSDKSVSKSARRKMRDFLADDSYAEKVLMLLNS